MHEEVAHSLVVQAGFLCRGLQAGDLWLATGKRVRVTNNQLQRFLPKGES